MVGGRAVQRRASVAGGEEEGHRSGGGMWPLGGRVRDGGVERRHGVRGVVLEQHWLLGHVIEGRSAHRSGDLLRPRGRRVARPGAAALLRDGRLAQRLVAVAAACGANN